MKIASHLDTLSNAADVLKSMSFVHAFAFQNTLLSQRDITTVIRDAEPHESKLFMLDHSKAPVRKTSKVEVARDTNGDINALLQAAEKLLKVYPIDSEHVQAEIDLIRHKYSTIEQSIAVLEAEVEAQRQQLDVLTTGRDYDDDINETVVVTEEMLESEEAEIRQLEAQMKR